MSIGKSFVLVFGGAAIGAGATYLVLKKRYEAQTEEEIASVREAYLKRLNDLEAEYEHLDRMMVPAPPPDLKVTPGVPMERVVPSTEQLYKAYNKISPNPETVEELKETVEGLSYSRKEETVKEETEKTIAESGYKYLAEDRDVNTPYVIPVQAYMDGEELYNQFTFTYYAGDKTLVNEADEVVEDINGVVGFHNLDKFGEESGNTDTVYIRNDRLESEYELLRDPDKFSANVMSIDTWDDTPEPPIKKFR